ncbi:efflux RND transporter periplasmic adaptor subunit [Pseudoxanthomonas dokdonensis]|uniref:efflux RND transporter periplasmic adaptor subunit n=1 Tax=Pseudoxanthomonas dokdonensis TaxID=344882 RepID=UPI0009FACCAF|nr:efflux RND transporter periplasmic adaptor subunit [Pseudoxanthomonas dokdonensis]
MIPSVVPRILASLLLAASIAVVVSGCNEKTASSASAAAHAGNPDPSRDDDGHGHADADADADADAHDDDEVEIDAAIAEQSGIRVAPVVAGVIADEHVIQGLLTPIDGRVAEVSARFPGAIRQLTVNVGDQVRAGQPLAIIASNLSLSDYTVSAPLSGVVLARHASVGGVASEGMLLYEIADLSSLWVDLHVFGADAQHITAGSPVTITRLSDGATADTRLQRILPGTATVSQSTVARAQLDNSDGQWRPGSAVKARITVAQTPADRVLPLSALQSQDGNDVVFVRSGNRYRARVVRLGQRDARQVQVLDGVDAGDQVVVEQSYLIKADMEKSGASHEH